MDALILGQAISALRKKQGLTQAMLADKLGLSDKTISKWESGRCYPDVTVIPKLAEIFSVTTDFLLRQKRRGITVMGNLIVDAVKKINGYPKIGYLSNIISEKRAVGGAVLNVGIDLATIDKDIPVSAIGGVGDDENGRFLISQLKTSGIDVSGVVIKKNVKTSYTDVMSTDTERTFFSYSGANACFSIEDVDLDKLCCTILHFGYVMLMDAFDKEDAKYGTVLARFLSSVQKMGIKTSVDAVTCKDKLAFSSKIIPALKYTDYLILNELEICNAFNLDAYDESSNLREDIVKECMQKALDLGVSEKVIVHSKTAGYCLSKTGEYNKVNSFEIPKELIKGSVGAGDAFCAGCLYGLYNGYSDKEILEFASATAVCNLFEENSVDGMQSKEEILKISKKFTRKNG